MIQLCMIDKADLSRPINLLWLTSCILARAKVSSLSNAPEWVI